MSQKPPESLQGQRGKPVSDPGLDATASAVTRTMTEGVSQACPELASEQDV